MYFLASIMPSTLVLNARLSSNDQIIVWINKGAKSMLNWKLAFNIPDSQVRVQHTYLHNSKAEHGRTQPVCVLSLPIPAWRVCHLQQTRFLA